MSPGKKREPRNVSDVEPNSFGAQLRRLRTDAGMSQAELGEAIGADQARVSVYERGVHIPNEDIIIALAEALHISPGMFFEGTKFKGVLLVGEERREKLKRLAPDEWQMFDHVLDAIGDVTPDERVKFEEGFRKFLETWK